MKTRLANALAGVFMATTVLTPISCGLQRTTAPQNGQNQLVGAWRLVSIERIEPNGTAATPEDCTGQFVFTADGHAAVQVMYRNAGAGDRYAQGGYEATFGQYTVDTTTRTFTFHVDGALVRTLV